MLRFYHLSTLNLHTFIYLVKSLIRYFRRKLPDIINTSMEVKVKLEWNQTLLSKLGMSNTCSTMDPREYFIFKKNRKALTRQ